MMTTAYRRPESVLVVIYTTDGEVLLIKRQHPPDFWQSVTGTMEEGELAVDAAVRELAEETGISGVELVDCHYSREFQISSQWQHRYAPNVTTNTEYVFLCELEHRPDRIRLASDEHSEYLWLSLPDAINKVWSSTNRDALIRFLTDRSSRKSAQP